MHKFFDDVNYSNYSHYYTIKKYDKGSIVFSEGDICDCIGLVIRGSLKISTLTNSDKEYTISVLNENDIFGENLLFGNNNEYLGDCIAQKDSIVIIIKKDNLLKLFENKTILENYLNIISNNHATVRNQLKLYSQKSITDRIMFYLITESKKINSNIIPIKSKESLAHSLNIPRPSLSRELIKLKENNIIDFNRYQIILIKP